MSSFARNTRGVHTAPAHCALRVVWVASSDAGISRIHGVASFRSELWPVNLTLVRLVSAVT